MVRRESDYLDSLQHTLWSLWWRWDGLLRGNTGLLGNEAGAVIPYTVVRAQPIGGRLHSIRVPRQIWEGAPTTSVHWTGNWKCRRKGWSFREGFIEGKYVLGLIWVRMLRDWKTRRLGGEYILGTVCSCLQLETGRRDRRVIIIRHIDLETGRPRGRVGGRQQGRCHRNGRQVRRGVSEQSRRRGMHKRDRRVEVKCTKKLFDVLGSNFMSLHPRTRCKR